MMAWVFCLSGSAIAKAGVNANVLASALDNWSDEAENIACDLARFDLITLSGSLTASGIDVIQEFCSSHIAQKIVGYDPDAIGRSTATLILNILENNINTAKQIITDKNMRTYLGITTG